MNPPLNFVISHLPPSVEIGVGVGESLGVLKMSFRAPPSRNLSKSNNNRSGDDLWLGWESESGSVLVLALVLVPTLVASMVESMFYD